MAKVKRHWSKASMVVTSRTEYSNGGGSDHGYCRECFADMADYGRGVIHYNSHTRAKARGLWGQQSKRQLRAISIRPA